MRMGVINMNEVDYFIIVFLKYFSEEKLELKGLRKHWVIKVQIT